MASKKILRDIFLAKRMFLSDSEYHSRNKKLKENLARFIAFEKYNYLHTFLSIAAKKEVLTAPIIELAKSQNPQIKVLITKTLPESQLAHFLLEHNTIIETNKWGIPEPVNATPFSHEKVDLILIPLISFDRSGHRIGYGKGYYDRFLKSVPNAKKIGLSLGPPLDLIPFSDEMDVKLDACFTPFATYSF